MNNNRRSSGRLFKKDALCYDEQGWEIPCTSVMQPMTASPTTPSLAMRIPKPESEPKPVPIPASRQSKSSRRKEGRILRPKNPFIHFRSNFYSAQRRISNDLGQNEISIQAGRAWKRLSEEEQRPYRLLAEKEKREHQAKYPDYVYTPGNNSKQKVRSGGIKKNRTKRKSRHRTDSEEVDSLPLSPHPTRLLPESKPVSSCTREASPAPQTQSQVVEMPEPEFVATKSENLCPTVSWDTIPTENIPPLELSAFKIEKPSEYDLSLRPPSYDYVDAPLGFKSTVTPMTEMDAFLPNIRSSSPESDADIDFKLFARVTKLSMLSITASQLQAEWEFERQATSLHNDEYTYIDFSRAHMSENEDNDTTRKMTMCEQFVDEMLGSPIMPSWSITKAEEDEMDQYVDFEYDG